MKAQIPWLRVFVEGVVIVGSILLAFGLQAWWDGVQERGEEQEYLRALQADFQETQDLFLREIASYEVIGEHNRTFLRLLDSPIGSVPVDSLELMVRKAFIYNEFTPVLATYNDMVNSGALSLLESDTLRVAMARFEASLQWVQSMSEGILNHFDNDVVPYLTAHFNLSKVYGRDAKVDLGVVVLPGINIGPPVSRLESDGSAFWSREFANLLSMKTSNQQDAVRFGRRSLVIVEEVLRLIEGSIKD